MCRCLPIVHQKSCDRKVVRYSCKKKSKNVFGELELTWPAVIIAAVAAGAFTAAMAIIPAVHYTSFNTITVTLEMWILFGIIIIMNSKSNLDSALKCFVFFLISQPLVYLVTPRI